MNIREAMINMVDVAVACRKLHEAMADKGYSGTPYWTLYSVSANAVYMLAGEHTDTFEESVTYRVLHDDSLTNKQRASILLSR